MIKFDGDTAEEQLMHAKQMVARYKYDSMTNLKCRLDFDEAFDRMIDSRIFDGRRFTFALVDINGLKQTNDNYGYLVGDELIKKVAKNLLTAFGKVATVYRFGGDEFAILCSVITREKAKKIFDKIEDSHDFSYGIVGSEEVDWEYHNCRSIFNFANNLLIDAKSNFKEQQRKNKQQK